MTIFLNNQLVESFNFPAGECYVKVNSSIITDSTNILAYLYNSDSIMRLLLTIDAVRRVNFNTNIKLTIPYFPYARQDRVCNEGESHSVRVMADLINSMNCNEVVIYDPHSDVTPALLNNCKVISLAEIISESIVGKYILSNNLTLISPDAGAEKKVTKLVNMLSRDDVGVDVIYASKIRNTLTGDITLSEIHADVNCKNLMIVDDICDGGKTFLELHKILKNKGAGDIYLYVTHGIFSKGLEQLKQVFKHIYCYHTVLGEQEIDKNFLTIFGSKSWKS